MHGERSLERSEIDELKRDMIGYGKVYLGIYKAGF